MNKSDDAELDEIEVMLKKVEEKRDLDGLYNDLLKLEKQFDVEVILPPVVIGSNIDATAVAPDAAVNDCRSLQPTLQPKAIVEYDIIVKGPFTDWEKRILKKTLKNLLPKRENVIIFISSVG